MFLIYYVKVYFILVSSISLERAPSITLVSVLQFSRVLF
jgi:hypothetical protein